MRVYLDVCAIQRPFDDQRQLRVRLEAEAVLGMLAACAAGEVDLVASDVHYAETARNPYLNRRDFALEVLGLASGVIPVSEAVATRAAEYAGSGIPDLDALHLASAVAAGTDYFCTADDLLLKKGRSANTGRTRVVSPLELIEMLANR